ncbi:T9SS type A sorting domain-containing protein [Saprospiraceae bacterium]|nr:T9SS type A sorting domain-containing protein [Saprospiraceae bacterium]
MTNLSKQLLCHCFIICLTLGGLNAQDIIQGEYYFGVDPGFGQATSITFTAGSDITNEIVPIDISTLSNGHYILNLRTLDDNGSWSKTTQHSILKSNPNNLVNINKIEYFFGNDPGFGLGASISLTPGTDISDELATINVSSITDGSHILNLRSQDENGVWSIASQHVILKTSGTTAVNINEFEYFFDTDPGFGNGQTISVSGTQDISDFVPSINLSGISNGSHNLMIRSKTETGIWSHTASALILKMDPITLPNIVQLEYYFGNDPGTGNGQTISVTPTSNIVNLNTLISTSSLPIGSNSLNIRSLDNQGSWSHVSQVLVLKMDPIVVPNIVQLEYYFGNDPGVGNGQSISVTPSSNIVNLSALISTASLPSGTNALNIRSLDSEGTWSHVITQNIFSLASIAQNITKVEYYFGNDPGKGNAINVPVTPGIQLTNINIPIATSSMPSMINLLSIRSMSIDGKWSMNNQHIIAKQDPTVGVMKSFEYYFDIDPGKGNGTTIDPGDAVNVPNLLTLINSTGISNGMHTLSFRSLNDKNQWSHDQHFLVMKRDGDVVRDIVAAEYFMDDDPGEGAGIPIAIAASNELTVIETIDESTFSRVAKELHVRTQDISGKWSHNTIHLLKKRITATSDMQEGEYFFDTDPGIGLATNFVLPSNVDVSDLNVIVMAGGLVPGMHDLYVRTKSLDDKWSLTNVEIDLVVETALPLTWLDFSIEKLNNEALLQWSVAAAINTSHFEVEKQVGLNYVAIGQVQSLDNADELSYDFLDRNIDDGWNYYRINQIDQDGHSSYSEVRGVFFDKTLSLSVFPNPTTEKVMIQGASSEGLVYTLYSANQQVIKNGRLAEKEQIDLSNYTSGSYILLVENGKDTQTFLIIKQ